MSGWWVERGWRDLLLDLEVFVLNTGLVSLRSQNVNMSKRSHRSREVRTLIRWTAFARSSGVRNHAFVGESGKKNLSNIA